MYHLLWVDQKIYVSVQFLNVVSITNVLGKLEFQMQPKRPEMYQCHKIFVSVWFLNVVSITYVGIDLKKCNLFDDLT